MSSHWMQLPKSGSNADMVTYQNTAELQNSCQQDSLTTLATSSNPPSIQRCVAPHYPAHFTKGSIIHLASGELKRVEDLSTEDFVRSAKISKDLCIDTSVVRGITPVADRDTVMLQFTVGQGQVQIEVESTVEHPFFVYNRGWSSCCPERTLQRYRLHCHQLMVNDKCISLTQKSSPPLLPTCTSFVNGSLAQVMHTQPVSSLSRTRLASDSAALSRPFYHGKS